MNCNDDEGEVEKEDIREGEDEIRGMNCKWREIKATNQGMNCSFTSREMANIT